MNTRGSMKVIESGKNFGYKIDVTSKLFYLISK